MRDAFDRPRPFILSHRLVRSFMSKGWFELALEEIVLAQAHAASDHALATQKWQCLSKLGRPEEAIPILERQQAQEGGHLTEPLALAWLYRQAGDLERASALLREALEAHPDSHEIHHRLSVIEKGRGHLETALGHIGAALERAPRNATYLFQYARRCRANRDPATARSALEHAIRLDPQDATYRAELDSLARSVGEPGVGELP